MKWLMRLALCVVIFLPAAGSAAEENAPDEPKKVLLMITEQNIGGPQRAWWASEIDLSIIESSLAESLLAAGYETVSPESLRPLMQEDAAYRLLRMRKCRLYELANSQDAYYIIKGRALASQGDTVPQSGLRSYYASVSVRVIRVKDEREVAVLRAWGKSVHADAVMGGSEALSDAGKKLSRKIADALTREGAR